MADTRFNYEYRFAAVGGLERKYIGPQHFGASMYWKRVAAEDFLSMTWEELEHVAHVIRDASRPKFEGEAA